MLRFVFGIERPNCLQLDNDSEKNKGVEILKEEADRHLSARIAIQPFFQSDKYFFLIFSRYYSALL